MAKKPKEVKEIKPECCLTCDYLLTCAEIAGAKCRNYKKGEIDKTAISTRFIEAVQKLNENLANLKLVEQEMQIAEKVGAIQAIQPKEPEGNSPISKRNKKIVKLVEQGMTIEEIADELELKPETVRKEIEYLTKIGVLKEVIATNKLAGKKATLLKEGSKVIVLPA